MTFMPSMTVRAISSKRVAGERWRTSPVARPGGEGPRPTGGPAGGEHVVGGGVDDEPATGVELAVELALRPARYPAKTRQVLDVDRELDRVAPEVDGAEVSEQGRPPLGLIGAARGGDADGGVGRHRAAHEHDTRIRGQRIPARQGLTDCGLARPVEHHSQGAVLAVLEHEHDRTKEVRVVQRGRRDEADARGQIRSPPDDGPPGRSGWIRDILTVIEYSYPDR